MNTLDEIMAYNREFVDKKEYTPYKTDKFPDKKMVVISCMDTRLVELLPKAMNISNGDVKIIKTAGAIVNHPFGSVMRSVLVAIHALGAEEVFVVGHEDCGMSTIDPDVFIDKMKDNGVPEETFQTLENVGIKVNSWVKGFSNVQESVNESVNLIKNHPLIPAHIPVTGMVINPETGKLSIVTDGYEVLDEK
ncbi:carbonic anhydrase [Bacillus sp. FJAT-27916]|uniref:beta-class carbonic anhydrase n=1 Tax=Bacillaceae TaxID=186817 RepID=UPI000670F66C|nr:carbonic anhydrase [Bacillus sp. FJAT-27916]KMY45807.1 carbonic anhydrase [Bacillus sp. FJAT-27916]